MRPALRLASLLLSLAACTGDSSEPTDTGSTTAADTTGTTGTTAPTTGTATPTTGDTGDTAGTPGVLVSGDAFAFTLPGTPYGRVVDGTVRVLEAPELTTQTDADGHFELTALPPGSAATFVLEHPDFPPTRTRTFTLPAGGPLERVTFQVPDFELFATIAALLEFEADPAACQIVSTVTRVGKSIYDPGAHGEADATVTITPAIPAENGPIYFNDSVIPDRTLTQTSTDGGVLFVNVPPGTYELQAHKDGVEFEAVTIQCEAGVLANASPPYGLQAL
jgi:hypothetical protein